jgi:hypothetical protein
MSFVIFTETYYHTNRHKNPSLRKYEADEMTYNGWDDLQRQHQHQEYNLKKNQLA